MRYYYTFGDDPKFPYQGGWVMVIAKDWDEAHEMFRHFYQDRSKGIINCAFFYTEEQFAATDMAKDGNRGAKCHRVILKNWGRDPQKPYCKKPEDLPDTIRAELLSA